MKSMNDKIQSSNDELFEILSEQKNDQDKLLQYLAGKVEQGMKILEDGIEEAKHQLKSEISLVQQEASSEKDNLRDLLNDRLSDVDKKINNEANILKEMLDKESEERQLETDSIRNVMAEEAKLLKDEVDQKTNALQDVLGQVQSDIQDTKDKGLEEVKQMIIEEKEERQKE